MIGRQRNVERGDRWSRHANFGEHSLHVVGQGFFLARDASDRVGQTKRMSDGSAESGEVSAASVDETQGQGGFAGQDAHLVGVEFDAEQLAADEQIVAVSKFAFALDTNVGAVAAIEIGERELAVVFFDAAMRPGHVEVARKVQVTALASDLE